MFTANIMLSVPGNEWDANFMLPPQSNQKLMKKFFVDCLEK